MVKEVQERRNWAGNDVGVGNITKNFDRGKMYRRIARNQAKLVLLLSYCLADLLDSITFVTLVFYNIKNISINEFRKSICLKHCFGLPLFISSQA